MAEPNKRLQILENIERGEISAEEGWQRLQDLNGDDVEYSEDVAEVEQVSRVEAIPLPALPQESPGTQPPPPDFAKWRSMWTIPLWVGVGVTIVFAFLMAQAALAGSAFWVLCTSLPFAIGILLIIIGWGSRTARWLHLRVQQPPGETPQRIVISFPLPLRFAGWVLRIFHGRIKGLEGIDMEGVLAAVGSTTGPENPLYIEVDGGDGEKVQIYIG